MFARDEILADMFNENNGGRLDISDVVIIIVDSFTYKFLGQNIAEFNRQGTQIII